MPNVLLTCAGRRHYLVRYFRDALGGTGKVLAADASLDAPAMHAADQAFQVPYVSDPGYVDALLKLCEEHDVRLVLSLNDLELPVLAAAKDRFQSVGAVAVVSDPAVIDTCFDKAKTHAFLTSLEIAVPRQRTTLQDARQAIAQGAIKFPLVVKPRWGTASLAIDFPETDQELELCIALAQLRLRNSILSRISSTDWERCVLIQEKLPGQEYGMDIINDLEGRHVTTIVKRKLSMRAGETDRAEVVSNPELQSIGARIGQSLKHVGNLDCDVFVTPEGVPHVLELNPRFGGGYPFSHEAGANIPAALVAWATGKSPDPSWFQPKTGWRGSKCDIIVSASQDAAARRKAG